MEKKLGEEGHKFSEVGEGSTAGGGGIKLPRVKGLAGKKLGRGAHV